MRPSLLLGLAILLVAVLAAVLILRPDESTGRSDPPSSAGPRTPTARAEARPGRPALPQPNRDRVRRPVPTDDEVRTHVRDDGAVVRDHRPGAGEPSLDMPSRASPSRAKLAPQLVHTVRVAIQRDVDKCLKTIDISSSDRNSRLRGRVFVSVGAEKLRVDRAELTTEGLADGDALALIDCVEPMVEDMGIDAPGQKDVSEVRLALPFRLDPAGP